MNSVVRQLLEQNTDVVMVLSLIHISRKYAERFIRSLPEMRRVLATDIHAAFDGYPAATCIGAVSYTHLVLYGNIVNIILEPLFIFYFGLGVEGAAWATALSQGLSLIHISGNFLSGDQTVRVRHHAVKNSLQPAGAFHGLFSR